MNASGDKNSDTVIDAVIQVKLVCVSMSLKRGGDAKCDDCGELLPYWRDVRLHYNLTPAELEAAMDRWLSTWNANKPVSQMCIDV